MPSSTLDQRYLEGCPLTSTVFPEANSKTTTSPSTQSEYGDIYKVTLDYVEETVREVRVKYFDTLPPCSSICVLKTGFLFAASEFGNHSLYQFAVRVALSLCQCGNVCALCRMPVPI